MIQRTLFDDESTRGMHRRSDPVTSREAAKEAICSGRAATQRGVILEAVRSHPGCTSAELAQLTRHAVARRLPELAQQGLVRRGESRICRANGTKAVTWWPL